MYDIIVEFGGNKSDLVLSEKLYKECLQIVRRIYSNGYITQGDTQISYCYPASQIKKITIEEVRNVAKPSKS